MRHTVAKCWISATLAVAIVASSVRPVVAADPPTPEAKPEMKPEAKPEMKPEGKLEAKPAAAKTPAAPAANSSDPNANDPVEIAIRKAVGYLYKTQKGDNWEETPRRTEEEGFKVTGAQWGGLTAMATYGLLAAGESPQNPHVAKAIDWLTKADVIGTYAMGMKLQIWNYVEHMNQAQKDALRKDATLLLNGVKTSGVASGLYHYWTNPTMGNYDHSCSNYGVLGMWAAAQQNLEVPTAYWELVDKAWRKNQTKEGGWAYLKEASEQHPASISLTPAGVATLFITQEMIGQSKAPGECKGNVEDKDIERGIKWMSDNYKTLNGNLYAMYNIERTGTASGYKYFGTIDWYKNGAAYLVKNQKPDGSWEGGHGGTLPGTVWGILFLVKGRAPVMMSKLEYAIDTKGEKGVATNWNQRPRDIANLARWTGKQLEKELNWQVVNLKVDIEDLHDAPVLYMSGNQAINLSKEDKDKLKQYVEGGGMIVGHADCNDSKFSTSFQKLGQELFKFGEFEELPSDHLIYNVHFNRKNWGNFVPTLRGLSNGAREVMVLIPSGDPGRYWQIQNFSSAQTRPMAEMASNIYLYAVDKAALKSRFKGQTYIVKRNEKIKDVKDLKVARIEYGGRWDPEPGGWRRMANILHNDRGINTSVETVALGTGKLRPDVYKLAHMTGTSGFKLTPEQRKELKEYADGGGTLLIDAAGGAAEFKESMETELREVFGDAAKSVEAPLPVNHKVYAIGGDDLSRAAYRSYARTRLSGINAPRLRGIEINNRTAVLYSQEDLSVGLVGMTIDGIFGYEPQYASELMENITMLAMGGAVPRAVVPKPPEPPPAEAKPKEEKKMEEKKKGDEPKKPGAPEKKKVEEKKKEAK